MSTFVIHLQIPESARNIVIPASVLGTSRNCHIPASLQIRLFLITTSFFYASSTSSSFLLFLFAQIASAPKMSWRNQGITGSNNIPLGKRRFGGDEEENGNSTPGSDGDARRGRDPEPRTQSDGPRQRKKRNRWGDASENKAAGLMGLPTAILSNMTSEQLEAYTLHLRIEEISQKLRIDDVVPADGDRYVDIETNTRYSGINREMLTQNTDLLLLRPSTTTTVDVSTRANTDTENAWKMNAINSLKRP